MYFNKKKTSEDYDKCLETNNVNISGEGSESADCLHMDLDVSTALEAI